MTEDRNQKTENRSQMTEDRNQMTEVGGFVFALRAWGFAL
ncbi:hypothetical protein D1AOALGA4SA_11799 [Olavius algarvensis Delta 1 endosymbiont]|nr:hypothetical protein D1AOALGA4SA_11799 [Olavius algarvensis Delta 1 endosymbiont]